MVDLIHQLKSEARVLHRQARQGDPAALRRVRLLKEFRDSSDAAIVENILRRHCLAAVAREIGFDGWPHALAVLTGERSDDFGTILYPPRGAAYWNIWSASYEEAKSLREQTATGSPSRPDLGIPDGTPGIANVNTYIDEEKLDSIELGWKQQWLDGRAHTAIAAYWMDWTNQKGRSSAFIIDANGSTSNPYVPDDPVIETDVQFGVTRALLGHYVKHDKSEKAPAPDVNGEWYSLDHTFVMEPGVAKLPRPPIQ